jgi:hypothetical protein
LQISAANLLVAGQQAGRPQQAASQAAASKSTFAPLDFKTAVKQAPAAAVESAPGARTTSAQPAVKTFQQPGSQLDITI